MVFQYQVCIEAVAVKFCDKLKSVSKVEITTKFPAIYEQHANRLEGSGQRVDENDDDYVGMGSLGPDPVMSLLNFSHCPLTAQ